MFGRTEPVIEPLTRVMATVVARSSRTEMRGKDRT